jgi:glycine cleavage system H protein
LVTVEGISETGIPQTYEFPDELYYHPKHIWTKKEKDNSVKLGFDDYVSKNMDTLYLIKLPTVGYKIVKDKRFGIIESKKYVGPIISPISGEVTAVNPDMKVGPQLAKLMKDPYDKGWLMIVKPSDFNEEARTLIQGNAVINWIKKEMEGSGQS